MAQNELTEADRLIRQEKWRRKSHIIWIGFFIAGIGFTFGFQHRLPSLIGHYALLSCGIWLQGLVKDLFHFAKGWQNGLAGWICVWVLLVLVGLAIKFLTGDQWMDLERYTGLP